MSNIIKIYNKYKLTNSNEIFELIINLYLLECEYRNIFQIKREKNEKLIKKLVSIIKKTKYNYKIYNDNDKYFRLIIYNQNTFNIDKLDETWGKQFAKQLGNFYICATDNFDLKSYNYQIIISVSNNNIATGLYMQMCQKNTIIKNINKIIKIHDDINTLLLQLDNNLYTNIQVFRYKD
jgi:hypothetical protein